MVIPVRCGNCGAGYKVPDHYAGRRAACKTCGQVVQIPSAPTAAQAPGAAGAPADDLLASELGRLESAAAVEQQTSMPLSSGPLSEPLSGPLRTLPLKRRRSSKMPPWLWAVIGGGAAVFVMLLIVVAVSLSGGPQETAVRDADAEGEAGADSDAEPPQTDESPAGPPAFAAPRPVSKAEPSATPIWEPLVEEPASPSASETESFGSGLPQPGESPQVKAEPDREPWGAASSSGPPDSPFAAPADTHASWGAAEPGFSIQLRGVGFFGPVTYANRPHLFMAAGQTVVNLETGDQVGRLNEKPEGSLFNCTALSADGKFLAHYNHKQKGQVTLISCETGGVLHELTVPEFEKEKKTSRGRRGRRGPSAMEEQFEKMTAQFMGGRDVDVNYLQFADGQQLLAVASADFKHAGIVWDAASGEVVSQFPMDGASKTEVAITPDGKHVASRAGNVIAVYELPRGKIVARMPPPRGVGEGKSAAFAAGMEFSPDGTELAGYYRYGSTVRLVCWSSKAEVAFDQPNIRLRSEGSAFVGPLQWVPDKSGWLLDGRFLLDRESKRIVWEYENPTRFGALFMDAETVMVNRVSHGDPELVRMKFPWDKIRQAMTAMEAGQDVLLKPGGAVSLEVKTGTIRHGSPQQTQQELANVLTERLAADGLSVAPGQPIRLVVFYTENAGETLRVVEQRGPFHFNIHDTGQRVEETRGKLEVKWVDEEGRVVWEREVGRGGPRSTRRKTVSDATLREDMFKGVLSSLAGTSIPYFVHRDPGVPKLPLVTRLE